MSDTSQGPGWWIASDGKWYPPDQQPGPATPAPPAPAAEPRTDPTLVGPTPVEPVPTEPVPVTAPMTSPPPAMTPPPMMTPPAGGFSAPPPMAGSPAAPPAKGSGCLKAVLIVGALLAVLGIATFIGIALLVNKGADTINDKLEAQQEVEDRTGIRSSSFNAEHPPQDDLIDGWACTSTENGFPLVTGSVENKSSKTSSYAITVEFKRDGTPFDSGTGLVASVDAGRSADFTATGSVEPDGAFTCRIASIERIALDLDQAD